MPYWSVARTVAHREVFAAHHLKAAGFQTFAPRIHIDPRRSAPLFLGYLFVRIFEQWRAVDRTIGILGLIRFGEQPARCPDAEIALLRRRLGDDGIVHLPRLRLGSRVRVLSGPFVGFLGLYAGMTTHQRELVLVNLLGRQTRVELAPGQLAAE
jgi:transcriptional antiterminator RfaH